MLQVLDAAALRCWCSAAVDALRAARQEIDDCNVYPVPDGDTGTNLLLTMQAVQQSVQAASSDGPATGRAIVTGALLGARGNSGVILSQVLRGLCEDVDDRGIGPAELCRRLDRAAELAWSAVAEPVEGTVLTVIRAAAEGARSDCTELAAVVRAAHAAADAALARTPEQLPVLRDAGVVDAGGRGLCVLLDAMERVVTGVGPAPAPPPPLVPRDRTGVAAAREAGSDAFAYEVQFLLRDTDDAAVARLRGVLSGLGDSLVVVGADGLFNVHVHVDDVGAALEAAVEAGRPFRITVTRFADQAGAERSARPADAAAPATSERVTVEPVMNERPGGRTVVAVAPGAGLAALFTAGGAVVVPPPAPSSAAAPSAAPSTAEVLAAVQRAGTGEVVVLPNDRDGLGVAGLAARAAAERGLAVRVVPTRSPVQGLAALAVRDDTAPLDDDVAAMTAAALATRWAEVTLAVRGSITPAGACRAGDALGLLCGEIVLVGAEIDAVAAALLDRLLEPGAELVTILTGARTPAGLAERLARQADASGAEVEVHDAGLPQAALLLGAE